MARDGRVQGFEAESRKPSTSVIDRYPDLTDRIFESILHVYNPIFLDIDKHTCTNLPMNIFHINQTRRRMARNNTRSIETNTFIVWPTSTASLTDFGQFCTMQESRYLPALEPLSERIAALELTFNAGTDYAHRRPHQRQGPFIANYRTQKHANRHHSAPQLGGRGSRRETQHHAKPSSTIRMSLPSTHFLQVPQDDGKKHT
jgi:hypothetical protein